jgi:NhaP-type Na+/H+ or K+/H+ antiporter
MGCVDLTCFVLYYPQDGDLSPKYAAQFMWAVILLVYKDYVGWLVGSLIGWLVSWLSSEVINVQKLNVR